MQAFETRLNRRNLLKGGAALGLSAMTPLLLSACGGGDGDTPAIEAPVGGTPMPEGMRETRHLNFDLSAAPIAEARLQLFNSKHHNARLQAHDAASRARHRQANPRLANVPDDKLTHYLEDVDFPADALQIVGVWGKQPGSGKPVLASHFIHVPKTAVDNLVKRRAGAGGGKLGATLGDASPLQDHIAANSGPWDVAAWMIFSHPSVMNVNADLGADILDRIYNLPCDPSDDTCTPYSGTLAQQIALLIEKGGYPSTTDTGSWAVLDPYIDPDTGTQAIDDEGNPVFMYKMNEVLSAPTAVAVRQILDAIMDDPTFIGTNVHPQSDPGVTTASPTATAVASAAAAAVGSTGPFQLNSNFSIGKTVDGIKVGAIDCTSDRAVSISVRHYYLRTLGVYVEFIDGNGNTLPPANKGGIDTDTAKFVSTVMADNQIMGVPILDDWLNPAEFLEFTMPSDAVLAKVHFGSLGLGGANPFSPIPRMGAISTLVLNMVLPAAFLVYGIATTFQKNVTTSIQEAWKAAVDDPKLLGTIVQSVLEGGIRDGVQEATGHLSVKPFVTQVIKLAAGLITKLLPMLTSVAGSIAAIWGGSIAASTAAKAIPFAGEALWLLSTAADVAALGESVVEVLVSPALKTYTLALTVPTTVRISHDANDFQFPATATHYVVQASYGTGSTPLKVTGTVAPGRVDPIDVPIKQLLDGGATIDPASGGQVSVTVDFYSDTDCLVGHGSVSAVSNQPDGSGSLVVPVTITEMLVPLNANTTYQHQSKLVYQGGARAWSTTAPAPALTRSNLCQGSDGAICALHGITVNTATGMAGYGFNAGGQGVSLCSGGGAASLNTIENLFLGNNPDSGLKFSACGSSQPIGIVYAQKGVNAGLSAYLMQGSDGFFHLRSLAMGTASTSWGMNETQSWGRFHSALDSLTVTDNGVAVGINRTTHKIEALGLPSAARDSDANLDSASANFAVIKSGKGSGAGYLDTPVAVASFGNVVLILEQGNKRVQAFDTDGNTTSIFKDASGKATPLLTLKAETGVTYLDIAVEGKGYVYVLSYSGEGTTPAAYRLDLYGPDGSFLSRTTGVAAGNIAVDLFRNVYTLNYEPLAGSSRVEPSLSQWVPHSTVACAAPTSSGVSRGLLGRARERAQAALAQCQPRLFGSARRLA